MYKPVPGDIKQVNRFNYLSHVETNDEICAKEIRRHFGIAEDAFQKLYKVYIFKCDHPIQGSKENNTPGNNGCERIRNGNIIDVRK